MRSPGSALVRILCGLAIACIATAGCSKKVTEPNSRPLPEGEQDGSMLMVGWLEQAAISFTVADPGTPNEPLDDDLHEVILTYWHGPGNLRTATLDASPASTMEAFRIASDGNVEGMFDFFLPPSLKFIGQGLDVYEFQEEEPPSPARYVGRGVDERVPTTASAVTNRVQVSEGTIDESLDWLPLPKQFALDSVFKIQYTEDPRAEFYIVAVNGGAALLAEGLGGSFDRRTRAIPHPLEPYTIPLSGVFFVVPPGVGQAGIFIPITSRVWPLTFYVRVTAYDADGRMVNRVNDFLRTAGRDGELNLTFFEPMGGSVEMLDPYPPEIDPVEPPDVLSSAQAMAILEGFFGGGAPTVTNFASSGPLLRSSGPSLIERQRALASIANAPMLRPEAVRRAIADVRARLDRRARGESPESVARTARPGRSTATR